MGAAEQYPTITSVIGEGAEAHRLIRRDGWCLALFVGAGEEDPRIHDLELARQLRYSRPRKIRDLIERLLRDGKLNDFEVRPTVVQTSERGGRPGLEYWLTRSAALKVIAKSETEVADQILDEVIRVYLWARDELTRLAGGGAAVSPRLEAAIVRLAEGQAHLSRAIADQSSALAKLADRMSAVEAGGGVISAVQHASLRHRVAQVARVYVARGRTRHSAVGYVYSQLSRAVGWSGRGRRWTLLPSFRFGEAMSTLDNLESQAAPAGATRDRQDRQVTLDEALVKTGTAP